MGLAIMVELPLVIVNSQRGGPSTGLPTKTEQSDLYQAVYGRNGDAPMPVIAARSPGDAFEVAIEACRIAVQYMTPVMLLTDGYIANAAEPWKVPDPSAFAPFPAKFLQEKNAGDTLLPYKRDEKGARPWIKPGTPGLMHRVGGIEKHVETGNIDYSPDNHQVMTDARKAKIDDIVVPDQAVRRWQEKGKKVSHIHVRHIWPLPKNLGELLGGFDRVLVPEMNTGQFKTVLRDQLFVDVESLTKTSGQPFQIAELEEAIGKYFDDVAGNEGGEVAANLAQLPVAESGHDDGSLKNKRSPQSGEDQ
jgi:2-oxoglutarate ferredoxin oxidoreductase subunit alpha